MLHFSFVAYMNQVSKHIKYYNFEYTFYYLFCYLFIVLFISKYSQYELLFTCYYIYMYY